jgi:RNA polymerase sigma-70 factor (ECF subfamily)
MVDGRSAIAEVDDSVLVKRVRAGEREAFSELVDRHAARIYRTVRHITKNDHDAEDVLQDAFFKAYSRLEQFHGEAQFSTWLTRIAVNESLMKLRKRRTSKTVSLDQQLETADGDYVRQVPSKGEDPEQIYGREQTRRLLESAVDSLAEGYRTVFVLRDVEGFSSEETGEMLGLSVPAVKSRLLRARLQLRDKLKTRLNKDGG